MHEVKSAIDERTVLIYQGEDGICYVEFTKQITTRDTSALKLRISEVRNLAIACVNWCRSGKEPDTSNLELVK